MTDTAGSPPYRPTPETTQLGRQATERVDGEHDGEPAARTASKSDGTSRSPWGRLSTVVTIAIGCVCPLLYVAYVNRYSVNSFNGDDWSIIPLVHAGIHGHLMFSDLWTQYNESRLFIGNVIDLVIGDATRLNLRSLILISAALFVAGYGFMLALFHRYLGKPLTPVPVLIVGVIWFSIADVQNSLWAFQISWYLTVFFSTFVLFALLVPGQRQRLWFWLAVIGAIGASLSTVQGFLAWPLGLTCLLWNQPFLSARAVKRKWSRRVRADVVLWLGAMACTVVVYAPGYTFGDNGCDPASSCSASVALHHPASTVRFFFALIGNVIPAGWMHGAGIFWYGGLARFEFVGVVLFVASVYIVVQSWRARRTTERCPLPLLLICFSLAFDVTIALGRSGIGNSSPLPNRYVMPNIILLLGVAIYAWAHASRLHILRIEWRWQYFARVAAVIAFAILLVVQVVDATRFGLTNGSENRTYLQNSSRLFVNLGQLPLSEEMCEAQTEFFFQPGPYSGRWISFYPKLHDATVDRLGEFQINSSRAIRALGPPLPSGNCVKSVGS